MHAAVGKLTCGGPDLIFTICLQALAAWGARCLLQQRLQTSELQHHASDFRFCQLNGDGSTLLLLLLLLLIFVTQTMMIDLMAL